MLHAQIPTQESRWNGPPHTQLGSCILDHEWSHQPWPHSHPECSSVPSLAQGAPSPVGTLKKPQGRNVGFKGRRRKHYDNENTQFHSVSSFPWKACLNEAFCFCCFRHRSTVCIWAFIFWLSFLRLPVLWWWAGMMNAQNCKVNVSQGCSALLWGKWFHPGEWALDWVPNSSSAIGSLCGLQRGFCSIFTDIKWR